MDDLLKVRKRMALEIAEAIEGHFKLGTRQQRPWDVDVAARLVECQIPLSNAEAQAVWDQMKSDQERAEQEREPKGPSLFDRLREALGIADAKVPLAQVIEAAIERLAAARAGEQR